MSDSDIPADVRAEPLSRYRPASDDEIRSWSFGLVSRHRQARYGSWRKARGSLDDPAIFGPASDYRFACGRYDGRGHDDAICDICGVKVTSSESRFSRSGHVDLHDAYPHPLADAANAVAVFPVMPWAFRQSRSGEGMARAYEALVDAGSSANGDDVVRALGRLVELLLPACAEARGKRLGEAVVFAKGMALTSRDE